MKEKKTGILYTIPDLTRQLIDSVSIPTQILMQTMTDAEWIEFFIGSTFFYLEQLFGDTSFRFLDNPTPLIIDIPTSNGLRILL